MALSSLDPLGRAGGVLPSADPSALEVVMDRNKQEDELAKGIQAIKAQEKAAAADNKQKEREAADKRKTALADGTLWFAHTLEGQKAYSNLVNSRAKRYQDYEAGIGADPDMEGTDAYIADQIELQAWNQMNANSEQLRGDHAKVKQYIMENRDLYTDDALEKTDEEYANPEYLKNGELPNTLVALIDLNKAIENQFGAIEAEVAAWANPASDGGIVSGSRTRVLPQSLKAQAEGMAALMGQNQIANQGALQLGAQQENWAASQNQNLINQLGQFEDWQQKKWNWDIQQPYEQAKAKAAELRADASQNIYGALRGIGGQAAATIKTGGEDASTLGQVTTNADGSLGPVSPAAKVADPTKDYQGILGIGDPTMPRDGDGSKTSPSKITGIQPKKVGTVLEGVENKRRMSYDLGGVSNNVEKKRVTESPDSGGIASFAKNNEDQFLNNAQQMSYLKHYGKSAGGGDPKKTPEYQKYLQDMQMYNDSLTISKTPSFSTGVLYPNEDDKHNWNLTENGWIPKNGFTQQQKDHRIYTDGINKEAIKLWEDGTPAQKAIQRLRIANNKSPELENEWTIEREGINGNIHTINIGNYKKPVKIPIAPIINSENVVNPTMPPRHTIPNQRVISKFDLKTADALQSRTPNLLSDIPQTTREFEQADTPQEPRMEKFYVGIDAENEKLREAGKPYYSRNRQGHTIFIPSGDLRHTKKQPTEKDGNERIGYLDGNARMVGGKK